MFLVALPHSCGGVLVVKGNKIMEANGTKEEIKMNILHSMDGYYVSNEGTNKNPSYHVWEPGTTHATCDSSYDDLSLAVARCNFLHRNKRK